MNASLLFTRLFPEAPTHGATPMALTLEKTSKQPQLILTKRKRMSDIHIYIYLIVSKFELNATYANIHTHSSVKVSKFFRKFCSYLVELQGFAHADEGDDEENSC